MLQPGTRDGAAPKSRARPGGAEAEGLASPRERAELRREARREHERPRTEKVEKEAKAEKIARRPPPEEPPPGEPREDEATLADAIWEAADAAIEDPDLRVLADSALRRTYGRAMRAAEGVPEKKRAETFIRHWAQEMVHRLATRATLKGGTLPESKDVAELFAGLVLSGAVPELPPANLNRPSSASVHLCAAALEEIEASFVELFPQPASRRRRSAKEEPKVMKDEVDARLGEGDAEVTEESPIGAPVPDPRQDSPSPEPFVAARSPSFSDIDKRALRLARARQRRAAGSDAKRASAAVEPRAKQRRRRTTPSPAEVSSQTPPERSRSRRNGAQVCTPRARARNSVTPLKHRSTKPRARSPATPTTVASAKSRALSPGTPITVASARRQRSPATRVHVDSAKVRVLKSSGTSAAAKSARRDRLRDIVSDEKLDVRQRAERLEKVVVVDEIEQDLRGRWQGGNLTDDEEGDMSASEEVTVVTPASRVPGSHQRCRISRAAQNQPLPAASRRFSDARRKARTLEYARALQDARAREDALARENAEVRKDAQARKEARAREDARARQGTLARNEARAREDSRLRGGVDDARVRRADLARDAAHAPRAALSAPVPRHVAPPPPSPPRQIIRRGRGVREADDEDEDDMFEEYKASRQIRAVPHPKVQRGKAAVDLRRAKDSKGLRIGPPKGLRRLIPVPTRSAGGQKAAAGRMLAAAAASAASASAARLSRVTAAKEAAKAKRGAPAKLSAALALPEPGNKGVDPLAAARRVFGGCHLVKASDSRSGKFAGCRLVRAASRQPAVGHVASAGAGKATSRRVVLSGQAILKAASAKRRWGETRNAASNAAGRELQTGQPPQKRRRARSVSGGGPGGGVWARLFA